MRYTIVKAQKDTFAVYQTIYSNADTNLQFDWSKRLNDTKWTDECYWLMEDEKRIGGLIILADSIRFPFLITPFCDRFVFWKNVFEYVKNNNLKITAIGSILDEDVCVLRTFGYKVFQSRHMMCRPTEAYTLKLNERFTYRNPDINKDVDEMTSVVLLGYENAIDYLINGKASEDEVKQDILYFLKGYEKTNTLNQSIVIIDKNTNKIVALCLAGRHSKEYTEKFSFIADITVIKEYRGNGLGEFMIKYALTKASKASDVMSLCVTVGNNAESLYHKLGFFPSPTFTHMTIDDFT